MCFATKLYGLCLAVTSFVRRRDREEQKDLLKVDNKKPDTG